MAAPFGIAIRTEALDFLAARLRLELTEFEQQQRAQMNEATNLVRREARRAWETAVITHTRKIVTGLQKRVKRMRRGLYEGRVYWGKKSGWYGKFHELGAKPHSVAPRKSRDRDKGPHHPGVPALGVHEQVVEEQADAIEEIIGDAFVVFVAKFEGRARSPLARALGSLREAA